MGFFDKKSRLLRKKIKDLQAELKTAEQKGTYDVKDGIFFAKLEEMGDQTMMAFAGMEALSRKEESVIEQFFQRNGFQVEELKIDSKTGNLSQLAVEPPHELVLSIGRDLKADGFRMIDDSEREPRPVDLAGGIYPLSALLDVVTALFSERVRHIIDSTDVKKNKEGATLQAWMPRVIEFYFGKYGPETVDAARGPFHLSYEKFYSSAVNRGEAVSAPAPQAEQMRRYHETAEQRRVEANVREQKRSAEMPAPKEQAPVPPPPQRPAEPVAPPKPPKPAAPRAVGSSVQINFYKTIAKIYKSLVRANSSRCVSNAQKVLELSLGLFDAGAGCVLARQHGRDGMNIFAMAGQELKWGEEGKGLPISTSIITECVKRRTVTTNVDAAGGSQDPTQSMMMHHITSSIAGPIMVDGELAGVLYIDRRGAMKPFSPEEKRAFLEIARVFSEYGDLTLGTL